MPKYRVNFTQTVSVSVNIEAGDPDAAIEAAYDEAPSDVCAQCSGWGQTWTREDAGELLIDSVYDAAGTEVYREPARVPTREG